MIPLNRTRKPRRVRPNWSSQRKIAPSRSAHGQDLDFLNIQGLHDLVSHPPPPTICIVRSGVMPGHCYRAAQGAIAINEESSLPTAHES